MVRTEYASFDETVHPMSKSNLYFTFEDILEEKDKYNDDSKKYEEGAVTPFKTLSSQAQR